MSMVGGDRLDADEPATWVPILRVGLAAAACWHLLGNAVLANGPVAIFVGVAAGAVFLWPRDVAPFVVLTVAVWWSIWQEAPLLGNHWLLVGFVCAAVALGSLSSAPDGPAAAARAVVLGFYAFAAFAKLNADFFDPATSCATFYFTESAHSLGLDVARPTGALGMALAITVATIELSIPVLLAWRRTRIAAVALAVVFHSVLAVDHRHQFYDFTTVLIAVFVTFLPVAVAAEWTAAVVRRVSGNLLRLVGVVLAVGSGCLVAVSSANDIAFEIGYAAWVVAAVVVVPAVLVAVWRHRRSTPSELPSIVTVPVAAVPVVVLVFLNGLTPYFELKTSASWNMYANLRTVNGDTNHFLIRATWPIGDAQADLVQVVAADGQLRAYARAGQLLPRRQVRWYLQHHPRESALLFVGDRPVEVTPGVIPEELGGPVSDVVGRLAVLRASEPEGEPTPCQQAFYAAT